MATGHSHTPAPGEAGGPPQRSLWIALALTSSFMVAEVIGGYLSNSVAIMTDAAHMLSDCSGFIISILSIIIG